MGLHSTTQIGEVIRNAVTFNIKNWQANMTPSDSIIQDVKEILAYLAQRKVDYLLVGGIAMLQYVEGRNTQDLDLIMAVSSVESIPGLQITARDDNFLRARFRQLQLDILLTSNPLFAYVARHCANLVSAYDQPIRIASVEGLLLLKLYALPSLYHQGDFTRVGIDESEISALLYAYPTASPALLRTLTPYLEPADRPEITKILEELQTRAERFRRGRG